VQASPHLILIITADFCSLWEWDRSDINRTPVNCCAPCTTTSCHWGRPSGSWKLGQIRTPSGAAVAFPWFDAVYKASDLLTYYNDI